MKVLIHDTTMHPSLGMLWNSHCEIFCICRITAIYTFISAYRGNWDVFVKYVDRLVKCCVKGDEFSTVTIWKIVFSNVKSITPVSVFLSSDIRYHPTTLTSPWLHLAGLTLTHIIMISCQTGTFCHVNSCPHKLSY